MRLGYRHVRSRVNRSVAGEQGLVYSIVLRSVLLAGCSLASAFLAASGGSAQGIQLHTTAPPVPDAAGADGNPDLVQFSADKLTYDIDQDVVTATGEVRMRRDDNRLRADQVIWNRKTGKVRATGRVAVINAQGDKAYGDSIDLTDTLRDGMVENMLVVLNKGGRLAADSGTRTDNGTLNLRHAAYTPCAVETADGCPKDPSWKVTAVRVTYRPERERIYFDGARFSLFGLPGLPLPKFSYPVGEGSDSGLLAPDVRLNRVNGLELAVPYYVRLAPNRGITVTPHVFTSVLPMLETQYEQLDQSGAFRITGFLTQSRRSDDLNSLDPSDSTMAVRGYLDGVARYQFTPGLSLSGSLRLTTDRTFLRRYDISRDDRLRSTAKLEHIDRNSYLAVEGWYVQTLRVNDSQGLQPIAVPQIDYRRRFDDRIAGGRFELQLNTVALTRLDGQDTQRAFASLRWDLRRYTNWGQQVTLTALARADAYHSDNVDSTPLVYRGVPGFQTRAIGAAAIDVRWPLVGALFGGTQRLTPEIQLVAVPGIDNRTVPNEDSRSVDLDTTNLFSLNRFPGYDRFEDSSRVTYGVNWALNLPGMSIVSELGQSYRLNARPTILYQGTGLSDRFSDIVGRTEIRYRDFVSLVARYRLDKDNFAIHRNEVDATIGSRQSYVLLGYLRLNRDIMPAIEDLQNHEEARLAGRVAVGRFWSAFASAVVDLTDRSEDPLSQADGFDPISHRIGVQYRDDCIRLGFAWRRYYNNTGDARAGNSYLLSLAFTGLGR